ncbi:hypothetical protein GP486_001792 [Trichoglossum hirsutum]|uniref:Heterokaryon incompatibility domain-containing protein n=1 Tax=Trichoglossum hirsutum TaxID=265104 RepID=A0A9P8LGG0_9PEZI|nr:hypothetical protein GP486_001792 [Trichoglossum hirsutum]
MGREADRGKEKSTEIKRVRLTEIRSERPIEKKKEEDKIHQIYPPWVDINEIRTWLDTCNKLHGMHCQNTTSVFGRTAFRPLWLIDVRDRCLKSASQDDRYVALSYVWGKCSFMETLKSNIDQLQLGESLSKEEFASRIPCTVSDAIKFTEIIGERYLWVDRLCIVQDDIEAKHIQIHNMNSIYANAYFTIVAALGTSADHGLRGIRGVCLAKTEREEGVIPKICDAEGERTVRRASHHSLVNRSLWNRRGWTFQELVFSQRALFFHDHTITWECHCAIWHESDKSPSLQTNLCLGRFSENAKGLQYAPWPNLEEYARLVKDYSGRKLTYSEDVLSAFNGITTSLSQTFEGGFIYGLPKLFFDAALLWQPRRPVYDWKFSGDGPQVTGLPSWSWIGWHGCNAEIDLDMWSSGYNYVRECPGSPGRTGAWMKSSLCTKSILQWYILTKNGKRPIINHIEDYSKYRQDPTTISLPHGWSRKQNLFYHICDPTTSFEYPIPIKGTVDEPEELPYTSMLSCKATSGWFSIRLPKFHNNTPELPILDINGEWAGLLKPQVAGSFDQQDSKCEFIAISAGSVRVPEHLREWVLTIAEWIHVGGSKGLTFDFYNVLWIRRQNGIAYRHGIGRILKTAWEKQATEVVDITLG